MDTRKLQPDAIFFDYGHTLVADTDDKYRDVTRYLAERGIDIDRAEFDRGWQAAEAYSKAYGVRNGGRKWLRDRYWYTFCREFLVNALGEEAADLADEMYATQFFTNTIYPDTIDVLRELRARGYSLGVISNWEAPTLYSQFDRFGMTQFFTHILPSREAEAGKPHPHIFRVALHALGVEPERAVHVGDSYSCDVIGARDIGITPIWVNPNGEPTPDGADVLQIRTRTDLLELVE